MRICKRDDTCLAFLAGVREYLALNVALALAGAPAVAMDGVTHGAGWKQMGQGGEGNTAEVGGIGRGELCLHKERG